MYKTITLNFTQTMCRHNIQTASWHDTELMPRLHFITWLLHIGSASKENFPSTRQETCSSLVHSSNYLTRGYVFFGWGESEVRGSGKGWWWWWWWRDDRVLSHYMYLSAHVFTRSCHLTWQVYQCPRLIRTRPSAWQAEPTARQSRLTAPQVAGGEMEGLGGGQRGRNLGMRGRRKATEE